MQLITRPLFRGAFLCLVGISTRLAQGLKGSPIGNSNGPRFQMVQSSTRVDMVDYIERFHNPVREHSKEDFLSSVEFEQDFWAMQTAWDAG